MFLFIIKPKSYKNNEILESNLEFCIVLKLEFKKAYNKI